MASVRVRTRMRPAVYWDEHNIERRCVVLEATAGREWVCLDVLDRHTAQPIADPPAAIPITTESND